MLYVINDLLKEVSKGEVDLFQHAAHLRPIVTMHARGSWEAHQYPAHIALEQHEYLSGWQEADNCCHTGQLSMVSSPTCTYVLIQKSDEPKRPGAQ
jgi:hypothetical protein